MFLFGIKPIPNIRENFSTCYATFPNWKINSARIYIVYTFLMQFLVPLILIIACYTRILIKVFSRKDKKESNLNTQPTVNLKHLNDESTIDISAIERQNTISEHSTQRIKKLEIRQHGTTFTKSKIKTIKLTLTVIILYIICSTPYFLGLIMNELINIQASPTSISNFFLFIRQKF